MHKFATMKTTPPRSFSFSSSPTGKKCTSLDVAHTNNTIDLSSEQWSESEKEDEEEQLTTAETFVENKEGRRSLICREGDRPRSRRRRMEEVFRLADMNLKHGSTQLEIIEI